MLHMPSILARKSLSAYLYEIFDKINRVNRVFWSENLVFALASDRKKRYDPERQVIGD